MLFQANKQRSVIATDNFYSLDASFLHPLHSSKKDRHRTRAFSLMELIVVIGIIMALLAVSMPAIRSVTSVAGRKGAISGLLSFFEQTRALALTTQKPTFIVFADNGEPEKYRYRAFAIIQEDESQNLRYASKWNFLPEGISFKNESQSIFGSKKTKSIPFPRDGDPPAEVLYVEFDDTGMIVFPDDISFLYLYVFEGFIDENGKERSTSTAGKAAETATSEDMSLYFDAIRISKYTGRARWLTPDT